MPKERPTPPPFEPAALERSLNRYLAVGLVFMVVLLAGFAAYKVREPSLREQALRDQTSSYVEIGNNLFATSCASCHGKGAVGGSGPTLNAKEFLGSVSDDQIAAVIRVGIPGSDMPSWGLDYGGTLTDEQVRQITAYLRSLEPNAPSVPNWRHGKG